MVIHPSNEEEPFIQVGQCASKDEAGEAAPLFLEQWDQRDAETRKRLEALLMEGLDSGPPTPMTSEDWAEIEREGQRLVEFRRGRTVR